MESPGLSRSYFYERISHDLRRLVHVKMTTPRPDIHKEVEHEMVMKVNLQDAIQQLKVCPVCASDLGWSADYPLEKSCQCGDFTIQAVWTDGDVVFEFKLAGAREDMIDHLLQAQPIRMTSSVESIPDPREADPRDESPGY